MDSYIGEIRLFAGNFAPKDWAFCNGQLLPITQNTALFSILGTMYGGDGKTNFALPNLQGRAPMHQGAGPGLTQRTIGEMDGTTSVTLLENQIPTHTHVPNCQSATNGVADPTNAVWSSSTGLSGQRIYSATGDSQMNPMSLQPAGGTLPHNNMQPYLGLNFIICMNGLFPPRN